MPGDGPRPPIEIAPEVADALRARRAVVALETAVLTHGLPRTPMSAPGGIAGWDATLPANLALSTLLESTVRAAGAVPATVAMVDGTLHVGLAPPALVRLAHDTAARKLSARDLGPAAAQRASGGTTVAGTLVAAALAGIRHEDRRLVAAGAFPAAMPTLSSAAIVANAWRPAVLGLVAIVLLTTLWAGLLALRVHSPAAARLDAWLAGLPRGMTTVIDATALGLVASAAIGRARAGVARWIDAGAARCIACGHPFGPQGAARCPECGVDAEVPSRPA